MRIVPMSSFRGSDRSTVPTLVILDGQRHTGPRGALSFMPAVSEKSSSLIFLQGRRRWSDRGGQGEREEKEKERERERVKIKKEEV